jgi:hypothetical protein
VLEIITTNDRVIRYRATKVADKNFLYWPPLYRDQMEKLNAIDEESSGQSTPTEGSPEGR